MDWIILESDIWNIFWILVFEISKLLGYEPR